MKKSAWRQVNTPELRRSDREAGIKARDALRKLILGKSVLLKTIRDRKGKYGRYIGEIFIEKKIQANQCK